MIWFILSAVVLLLIIIFLVLPCKGDLTVQIQNNNCQLDICVKVLGLTIYRQEKAFSLLQLDVENTDVFQPEKIKKWKRVWKEKQQLFNCFSRMKIQQYSWDTKFGLPDAPDTAIVSSFLWMLKAFIHALLDIQFTLKATPKYEVKPYYHQTFLQSSMQCIFSMRIGQAIHTLITLNKWKKKITTDQEEN
ncbi:hypothetical protein J2T56_001467 [Natronobacillus azotifigens]|uniref:DUF2953 domain-containing protein n=1 Tax=Natronobacillus azotifigens TaxID=472978 RepID=A0A9J6RCX6_9BACI|nr:DUF2953 domain-containing protein [Natronobacillus azotifigens]MCZ0703203.1 DUF2953 domain-containing protein [Natronobacillus azotifigens]